MCSYFDNVSIPDSVTHIKIDVGLGMYNINSTNWLCNESENVLHILLQNQKTHNMKIVQIILLIIWNSI